MSATVVYFEITFQYMRLVLGVFYLEGSEYEFIIEERTNNPSMLTACFTSL